MIVRCSGCDQVVFDGLVRRSYMVRNGEIVQCLPCNRKEFGE